MTVEEVSHTNRFIAYLQAPEYFIYIYHEYFKVDKVEIFHCFDWYLKWKSQSPKFRSQFCLRLDCFELFETKDVKFV